MNMSEISAEASFQQEAIVAMHRPTNVTYVPPEGQLSGDLNPSVLPPEVQLIRAAILIVAALIGIPSNLCIIFTISCSRFLKNDRDNALVFHMSVVCLFSCLLMLPVHGAILIKGFWPLDIKVCQGLGYLFSLSNQLIIWTIMLITAGRHQLIVKPLTCSNLASVTSLAPYFTVMWIMGLVCSAAPYFMNHQYEYDLYDGACVLHSDGYSTIYSYIWLVIMTLTFYIPPTVVGLCYCHVFLISRRQSRRLSALVHLVTVTTHSVTPHLRDVRKTSHASFFGQKAPTTIAKYLGSFLICYLPYSIVIFFEALWWDGSRGRNLIIAGFRVAAATLLHLSPVVHGYLYGVKNRLIWESFVYYVRRKLILPALAGNCFRRCRRRGGKKRPPVIIVSRPSRRRMLTSQGNNISMPNLNHDHSPGALSPDLVPRALSLELMTNGVPV